MITEGRPLLKDVDGTVKGAVMLMSIRVVDPFTDDPQQLHEYIAEGDHDEDPWTFALGFREGIKKDWPGHEWAIVGNWRARYLRWAHTMAWTLGEGTYSPEEYIETFEKRKR
jgi:hypothetical protein